MFSHPAVRDVLGVSFGVLLTLPRLEELRHLSTPL